MMLHKQIAATPTASSRPKSRIIGTLAKRSARKAKIASKVAPTPMRLLIPALLFLTACARTVMIPPPSPPIAGAEETGAASWYGHPYHGRRTASGEVYDMNDLTAAHRSLPLGTRLMVTNLDTGQAVEVRVNDRGPLIEERILDLSYAAAR